jgi:hypothetical protein
MLKQVQHDINIRGVVATTPLNVNKLYAVKGPHSS